MATEIHKEAYRNAWREFRWMQHSLTEERSLELQKIMDGAQNNFSREEWNEFAPTLPGFLDWWARANQRMHKAVEDYKKEAGVEDANL